MFDTMKKGLIFCLCLTLAACGGSREREKSPIPDKNDLKSMDWRVFDQTDHSGWRILSDKKEYKAAAEMIDTYLRVHPELDPTYRKVSLFHKGQMLASAGEYPEAVLSFEKSIRGDIKAEEDKLMLWDVYALALIAFLEKDKAVFEKYRGIYRKYSEKTPSIRLKILKTMSENFNTPYLEITQTVKRNE